MSEHFNSLSEKVAETISPSLSDQLGLQPGDLHGAISRAKRTLDSGNPAEALEQFVSLVLLDPNSIDVQIGLAECALELGGNEIAMQAAAAVILLSPKRPEGYLLSGRACLGMNEPALALEDFNDAIELARANSAAEVAQIALALRAQAESQL